MKRYEAVIGLEVHIELSTKSKMFCACSADYFTAEPNTHTCPICLGFPGAMPNANKVAVGYAQKFGAALGCQAVQKAKFDRKNYFYPDLAKGFQISQYDLPFSQNGEIAIEVNSEKKKIRIARAHLEEDTGKLIHSKVNGRDVTLIDFNRSGVPLLEIVTEPDMNSADEARAYAQKLQQIARYLGVSDADMEKGSVRIEPNVSLRKESKSKRVKESKLPHYISSRPSVSTDVILPDYKVELKNINSFRFVKQAIEYEIKRQGEILDFGKTPAQETRGYNEREQKTVSQRSKEFAHDYRYFPEPDLPPFVFDKEYLKKLEQQIPELADAKFKRFQKDYQLTEYEAEILARNKDIAAYFEEAVKAGKESGISAKRIATELINKKPTIEQTLPAAFVKMIYQNSQVAQIDDDELDKIIEGVLRENAKAVEDYKSGKQNAIMFLVGQVMRKVGKKIDSNLVKEKIKESIK